MNWKPCPGFEDTHLISEWVTNSENQLHAYRELGRKKGGVACRGTIAP